jgi:hypothetical protein
MAAHTTHGTSKLNLRHRIIGSWQPDISKELLVQKEKLRR